MLLHSYGGAVGTDAVNGLSVSERATRGLNAGFVRLCNLYVWLYAASG